MSHSKAVKIRIRENRSMHKIMAWKRPIIRLFGLIQGSAKLANNSLSGAHFSADYQKGVLYQVVIPNTPIGDVVSAGLNRRKELFKLIREANHHSKAKDTLAKLRSML
jgi:hypothetical protein